MKRQASQKSRIERKTTAQRDTKKPLPAHAPSERPLSELHKTIGNHGMLRRRVIQAKLRISPPGDRYEREADHVAEQVIRITEPTAQRQPDKEKRVQMKPIAGQITPLVQRQVEEEWEPEEEEVIQPKAAPGQTSVVTPSVKAQIGALRSKGQPLPQPARAYFEPRFGRNFGQVRIHTGRWASEAARAVKACAFTAGRDIVFGAGQYAPRTTSGKKLLAHELAHTIQQDSHASEPPKAIQRKPLSGFKEEMTRRWLSERALKYLDKPIFFSGKRSLTATIRVNGIEIAFPDGGRFYIDRSSIPLDPFVLYDQYKAQLARQGGFYTFLARLAGESPAKKMVRAIASGELSRRLFIIKKIAAGWRLKDIMSKLRSLNEENFEFIALSSTVVPIVAGMGMPFPSAGAMGSPLKPMLPLGRRFGRRAATIPSASKVPAEGVRQVTRRVTRVKKRQPTEELAGKKWRQDVQSRQRPRRAIPRRQAFGPTAASVRGFARLSPAAQRWLRGLGSNVWRQARKSLSRAGDDIIAAINRFKGVDGFDEVVRDYLVRGFAKKIGARFVMRYAVKHFARAKTLVFELRRKVGAGSFGRIADVFADGIWYEFKSVKEIYPYLVKGGKGKFGQVQKDIVLLIGRDLSRLKKLKWVFDGRKMRAAGLTRAQVAERLGEILESTNLFSGHPLLGNIKALLHEMVVFWP